MEAAKDLLDFCELSDVDRVSPVVETLLFCN